MSVQRLLDAEVTRKAGVAPEQDIKIFYRASMPRRRAGESWPYHDKVFAGPARSNRKQLLD